MAGHSMEPTLRDGDWLLVDPQAATAVGTLVVAADPRQPGRLLVKRVKSADPDGSLVIGGDHPAHAEEELRVLASAVRGRPWFRYWPVPRLGPIR